MNYNRFSNNLDYNLANKLCNRAKLDTGTHCNYECKFCYYIDHLNDVTKFDKIKERIDYLFDCGITEVDLSGGESSIHKDWFKILDYCNERFESVTTLSNGFKFADKEFTQKSKEHGLKEILFSLHGSSEELHDNLVQKKGGFKRMLEAIQNANDVGIVVRINCTVTQDNYLHLMELVNLIKRFDVFEVNFLTLNYWSDAQKQIPIDYNEVTPKIHEAIDNLKDFCLINVRYTPYCYMKGYEKYVCDYYQHIYDVYDWNIAVYDYMIDPDTYKDNPIKALYKSAEENRNSSYYKPKECFKCKHFYICDGIEKNMNTEVIPENGDKITDPIHYRDEYYAK